MRVRTISFDVEGESGQSSACVAPDARIFHSFSRVPLRVRLPGLGRGRTWNTKDGFFALSAAFPCELCGPKPFTAEDAEGSLSSRRKPVAELGFSVPAGRHRRHRLRSNPPVRLTPRADAGSCSSLQYPPRQADIDGAIEQEEIIRGDERCTFLVEMQ